jgi:hypothetical protein
MLLHSNEPLFVHNPERVCLSAHVSLLDALIRAETEIPMLMTWPDAAPAVIGLDPVSKVSELRWGPGSKRRSAMPASSWR